MVQTIRMVEPKYVLVENVAALLSNGMGTVLGDLAESGYDTEWDCLPAAAFGACHFRDRVFITGFAETLDVPHGITTGSVARFPTALSRWLQNHTIGLGDDEREGATKPGLARTSYGVANRVDRHAGIGNAVYPDCAEWLGQRILDLMREG